ncbi:MAG: hypothetical protein AAFV25_22565 [Bacteroidota bacterium]
MLRPLNRILQSSFWMAFLLLSSFHQSFAQDSIPNPPSDSSRFKLLGHIQGEFQYFTTDKLQQCYAISPTNELIKYNREGKELFRYNNNWLGELAIVDATNPFNLFLYYPEYMTVITLDRTLNETSTYNFFDLDLTDVQAAGMSNDNNIWLYDNIRFTLKKIDRQGNVLLESNNLNLAIGHSIDPNFLVERNNQVYLNDPELGILVFDNFANYLHTLPLKSLRHFQVGEYLLSFQQNQQFLQYDLRSLLTYQRPGPTRLQQAQQVRLQDNCFYLSDAKGLWIYTQTP